MDVTYVTFGCKVAPPSKKSIKKPDTGHDKITLSYFQIIFLRKFVHELNIIDNHNLFLKGLIILTENLKHINCKYNSNCKCLVKFKKRNIL